MESAAGKKTAPADREMTSLVNWALLGLVIERPSYGLELAKRFERAYGEVLPLSAPSHVYSALDALEKRGLIEIVPGSGFGRQPKTHYCVTDLGLHSYEEWLVAWVDAESRREELWVRQLGIFARNPKAALRVLERFQRQYLKKLGEVGMPSGRPSNSRARLVDELVSEQRRFGVGAKLSWLRAAQARFEALAGGESDEPART